MRTQIRKKKLGRPPARDPRHWVLAVRVTNAEAKAIRGMAAGTGLTVSTFILRRVLGVA
jgi:uncharacterized protein (DUF1778 family)